MSSDFNETIDESGAKRYRLIVSSAEEAVKVIREKLGETARVVSVKQIDGQGLARFLTSPKLEVIVTVPNLEQKTDSSSATIQASGVGNVDNKVEKKDNVEEEFSAEQTNSRSRKVTATSDSKLSSILEGAGFDQDLLNRLESHPQWNQMQKMPLAHALSDISKYLKSEYATLRNRQRENRVAFLGTPGVGKTTALCKLLVNEVFFNQNSVHVLKIDGEVPNADDALRVFCEVLGVPVYRHVDDVVNIPNDEVVFFDIPGVSLKEQSWLDVGKKLDAMNVRSRVLVLNAAYDTDVLKKTIQYGIRAKCTHLIFTHVDELSNATKLWSYVFSSGLTSILLCHGQSITDDFSENILSYLLNNTFPRHLLAR